MPAASQVIHGWIVGGITDDDDRIELLCLHEDVEVGFHVNSLGVGYSRIAPWLE